MLQGDTELWSMYCSECSEDNTNQWMVAAWPLHLSRSEPCYVHLWAMLNVKNHSNNDGGGGDFKMQHFQLHVQHFDVQRLTCLLIWCMSVTKIRHFWHLLLLLYVKVSDQLQYSELKCMDPNSWQIGTAARTVPPAITQNGPSKEQCKRENQACSDTEQKEV